MPLEKAWAEFKITHGRSYKSPEEEFVRQQIFNANVKKIEIHNYLYSKGLKTYSMGVNQFTDMDPTEVASIMNGLKYKHSTQKKGSTYISPNVPFTVPKEVDWRKEGYVTPVKNQGNCGSCWAFSTTGSVEGQHFRKTKQLVSLSEQNLVDCSTTEGNEGCNGGLMDNAFKYIKKNGGIDTEESYPYTAKGDDQCKFNASNVGATVSGFVDVESGSEKQLMEAIALNGPVSVAIDAGGSFQAYQSGIYDEPNCSPTNLDHGVLAVGYGTTEQGIDYWIVKNSWGEGWGEKGYIRMVRNKNNQCGIATSASYPLV